MTTLTDLLTGLANPAPFGCTHQHPTVEVTVDLDIEPGDWPRFPELLRPANPVTFTVYDQSRYDEIGPQPGYCHGADGVSWTVLNQGIWEGYETLLMLDVLARTPTARAMIDVGSHFGWFGVLAATTGHPVVAIEADFESAVLTARNAEACARTEPFYVVHSKIDADTPPAAWPDETPPDGDDDRVAYLKIDVEGNDPDVARVLDDLFHWQLVDVALVEVSPCFHPGPVYPDMVRSIADHGYDVHVLPEKGYEHRDEFGLDPLGVLRHRCLVAYDDIDAAVHAAPQSNFVFVNQMTL